MTNRELYLAIADLINDPERAPYRELEEYLRALLRICRAQSAAKGVTAEEFVSLLSEAFASEPLPYEPGWLAVYRADPDELMGFAKFEAVALQQIVDLREMRNAGILEGKWIQLGVKAPRGGSWYNFDPRDYLECAAAGSIGGWEPGDPTARMFVPGDVAVFGADGHVTSANPEELERPVYDLPLLTWEQFADFLICGQIYE